MIPDIHNEMEILILRRRWHVWARRQKDFRPKKLSERLRNLHLLLVTARPFWIETNWTDPEFKDW